MKIEDFFCIEELVSETVFNNGQDSWQFIDADLLKCLLIIRVGLSSSITINNWKWGGKFSQRGLRDNTCRMVSKKTKEGKLYLSAHTMGKALDFDVKGYTAPEVREWIVDNAWEPYQYYEAKDLWEMIDSVATALKDFHRQEVHKPLEGDL